MRKSKTNRLFGLLPLLFLSTPASAESFQEALSSAYQTNPQLHAQRERVGELDENYVQAQSAGRMTVGMDINVSRTLTNSRNAQLNVTQDNTPRNGALSLNQPLYQGGRINGLKSQASAIILAARQELRDVEQNVLFNTAVAYIDVRRDEEIVKIRLNNVRVLSLQKQASDERLSAGAGTRTEVAQASARLLGARKGLETAKARLSISQQAYIRFVGHSPLSLKPATLYILPPNMFRAQRIGLANNPQLLAARFDADAAKASIKIAKSAHLPSLSLNAQFQGAQNQSQGIPDTRSAAITAQIRIPIYSGDLNRSRVRAAKRVQARLKYEIRDSERAVNQTIASAWTQVISAKSSLKFSTKQVAATIIAFEGIKIERNAGTRSALDVLNAEEEVLNAKLSVIEDQRNLHFSMYQLLVTMGTFDAAGLRLTVDPYSPKTNFAAVTQTHLSKVGHYVPVPIKKIGSQISNIPIDIGNFTIGALTTDALIKPLPDPVEKIVRQLPIIARDVELAAEIIASSKVVDDYILEPPVKLVRQLPDIPKDIIQFSKGVISENQDDGLLNKINVSNFEELKQAPEFIPEPRRSNATYPDWRTLELESGKDNGASVSDEPKIIHGEKNQQDSRKSLFKTLTDIPKDIIMKVTGDGPYVPPEE